MNDIDIDNIEMSTLVRLTAQSSENASIDTLKTKGSDLTDRTKTIQLKRDEELKERIDARNNRPHPVLQRFVEIFSKIIAPIIQVVSAVVAIVVPCVGKAIAGGMNAVLSVIDSLSNFFLGKKVNEQQGQFLKADSIQALVQKLVGMKAADIDLIESVISSSNSNMVASNKILKSLSDAEAIPLKNMTAQQRG